MPTRIAAPMIYHPAPAMRHLPPVLVITLVMLVAGCDSGPSVINWLAVLEGQPGFEEVSGQVTATGQAHNTALSISIAGATPGVIHPWRIRIGDCDPGAPVFGQPDDYRSLSVGPGGTASTSVLIQSGLTTGTTYHVSVHHSEDDMGTLVACGRLSPT